MFDIDRAEALAEVHWQPEDNGLYYIRSAAVASGEIGDGPGLPIPHSTLEHGNIAETGIEAWLTEQQSSPQRGMLRIICVSKPKKHQSAQLAMTEETFCRIEENFKLSKVTISSLFNSSGVCSRFTEYDEKTRKPKYLRVVIKSKQKVNVGNWQISLCHDLTTNNTDALICGEGILLPINPDINPPSETQVAKLISHLLTLTHLWSHPLILPSILIHLFCNRIALNRIKVADKLVDLENEMGVTFAGRSKAKHPTKNWPHDLDIKQITINLNSTGASILYLSQTCIWTQECISFLLELCTSLSSSDPQPGDNDLWLPSQTLRDTLQHDSSALSGISLTMQTKQQRIQAQLNVLYSAASQKENAIALNYSRMAQEHNEIAQKDVALNTRIATSTKQDSIAMTTFTCITATLLPGTYVASLFSMGMVDWLDDGSEEGKMSRLFWVYWVVTVPLTVVVLGGWWLWYKRADRQWQKDTGYRLDGTTLGESSRGNSNASGGGVEEVKTA